MDDTDHLALESALPDPKAADGSASTPLNVDPPKVAESERAAVAMWTKRIRDAKKFYETPFKRMKECQKIATDGHDGTWGDNKYVVPVIKRHINVAVATLYARNP